jgi:hypothetical protein
MCVCIYNFSVDLELNPPPPHLCHRSCGKQRLALCAVSSTVRKMRGAGEFQQALHWYLRRYSVLHEHESFSADSCWMRQAVGQSARRLYISGNSGLVCCTCSVNSKQKYCVGRVPSQTRLAELNSSCKPRPLCSTLNSTCLTFLTQN